MELLAGVLDAVNGNGLAVLGVTAALPLLSMLLPNKVVRAQGVVVGKFISAVLRQRLGKTHGEKIESYLGGTADVFIEGVRAGANADDQD